MPSQSPPTAPLVELAPGLFEWSAFSPHHKVHLTSHAVLDRSRDMLTLVDPIRLDPETARSLASKATHHRIVLTNGNHERDCSFWTQLLPHPLPVFSPCPIENHTIHPLPFRSEATPTPWDGWSLFSLEGAGPNEVALLPPGMECWMLGDAIINLPGRTLEILPEKYTSNRELLLNRLEQFTSLGFNAACFAHGTAIQTQAASRIRALLNT